MILTLIIALFSLIALMVIHEFGHFIIAKKFGVIVDEFGIGYPPRIFGKKFGETIYSINLLPLGAFVRIRGEEGLDEKDSQGAGASVLGLDDYRSFTSLAIWKRIMIVLGGVIAFWIAAIIIFSIVFGMGADIPIGDQDISGLTNPQVKIIYVSQNSPAEISGIKAGDILIEAKTAESEAVKINKISDFQNITKNNLGKDISLTINREGKNLELSLNPRLTWPEGEGPAGVAIERTATLIEKYPLYMAPIKGAAYTWEITVNAVKGLYQVFANIFSGKGVPQGAEFAGPLGITVFLARAMDYGIGYFLYFIGVISVFVAIFNLFPIPALDGGKFVFLIIEKIRKKPVSAKIEQNITIIFFILLITMSIFITIRFDIPRLTDFIKSSLQK
jgi:regulator of sigma E protease